MLKTLDLALWAFIVVLLAFLAAAARSEGVTAAAVIPLAAMAAVARLWISLSD